MNYHRELLEENERLRGEVERLTRERKFFRKRHSKLLADVSKLGAEREHYKWKANTAEAKVAKLREALKPFAMLAHCLDYKNSQWLDHETHWMRVVDFNPEPTAGDLRRARAALQETEQ